MLLTHVLIDTNEPRSTETVSECESKECWVLEVVVVLDDCLLGDAVLRNRHND